MICYLLEVVPMKVDHLYSEGISKNIKRRLISNFLDIIILSVLSDAPNSGYDIIQYIFLRFNCLISSGTVYSTLYALERNQLLTAWWNGRKRMYKLSEKGQKFIKEYHEYLSVMIQSFTNFLNDLKAVKVYNEKN